MLKLQRISPNFHAVHIPGLTVWFSYENAVAFQIDGEPIIKSENVWSKPTGKHLGKLSGKTASHEDFEARLKIQVTYRHLR